MVMSIGSLVHATDANPSDLSLLFANYGKSEEIPARALNPSTSNQTKANSPIFTLEIDRKILLLCFEEGKFTFSSAQFRSINEEFDIPVKKVKNRFIILRNHLLKSPEKKIGIEQIDAFLQWFHQRPNQKKKVPFTPEEDAIVLKHYQEGVRVDDTAKLLNRKGYIVNERIKALLSRSEMPMPTPIRFHFFPGT